MDVNFTNSFLPYLFKGIPLRPPFPMINKQKKFIMFWMPRCGCTTSLYWFFRSLNLQEEIDKMSPYFSKLEDQIQYYRGAVWDRQYYEKGHFEPTQIINSLEDPEYFKFVIIRNPYSRIVSCYFGMMSNPFQINMLISLGLPVTDINKKVTFSQFVCFLFNLDLFNFDFHLRYQTTNVCWSDNFQLGFVIRLEKLEQGLNYINSKFNLQVPIGKLHYTPKYVPQEDICYADTYFDQLSEICKSNGRPHYTSFYNSVTKANVYNLYKADIDKLQYG